MPSLSRRCLAECLGTFGFVLVGCASVLTNNMADARYDVIGIALAHGAALGLFITAALGTSGGHLNPAVTLGLLSTRRIDTRSAGAYIVAQLAGAALAALALKLAFPVGLTHPTTLGTPALANNMSFSQGIAVEALFTFVLMSAVYGTAVIPETPRFGGFGIGLALLGIVMVSGPLTGAAVNPARAFGPALVSGTWVGQAIWWIGPILGAVVAAQVWERVIVRK